MLRFQRLPSPKYLELFLSGAYLLGEVKRFYALAGKTLTLSRTGHAEPAPALTFSAGASTEGLTFAEVAAQIADGSSELNYLRLIQWDQQAYLVEAVPRDGVAFSDQAQDALEALGRVAENAASTQVFGAPGSGKRPCVVSILGGVGTEVHLTYDDESAPDASSGGGVSYASFPGADVVLDPPCNWVYVGGAGNVQAHLVNDPPGVLHTFPALAGATLRIHADLIKTGTTTATNLFFSQR